MRKTYKDFMKETPTNLRYRRVEIADKIVENKRVIDDLIQAGSSTIPNRIIEDRLVTEDDQIRIALKKLGFDLQGEQL